MDCSHNQGLAARWDYLSQDETCGTGWIVCRNCEARLQRVTIAGGKFRGQGRVLEDFREQITKASAFSALHELEID